MNKSTNREIVIGGFEDSIIRGLGRMIEGNDREERVHDLMGSGMLAGV